MRRLCTVHRLSRSERGAVLVQVAVAILALIGFSVFVVDQGVLLIARGQAQNAADAGALAAAVARAFDDFSDPPPANGRAELSARAVAAANPVWQAAPVTNVFWDCPGGAPGRCARVEVFRDAAHGNPIETLFGPILGITSQNVQATATARVRSANATDCMRPIAFADDWIEQTGNNEFNRYGAGGVPLPAPTDSYTRPTTAVAGERTVSADIGERIIYEIDQPIMTAPITRQMIVGVTLPNPAGFYWNMKHCSGDVVQIGQTLPIEIPSAGYTDAGLAHIMGDDPAATWNEADHRIETSCVPGCGAVTPRLVAVALYDPDKFQLGRTSGNWVSAGCPSAAPCITVTNIVGFFVHGAFAGYGPHGHFLPFPGLFLPGGNPALTEEAAWLVTTHLVR